MGCQKSKIYQPPIIPDLLFESYKVTIFRRIDGKNCGIEFDNKNTFKLFRALRAYRGGESKHIRDLCEQNFPRWSRVRASAFALDLEGRLNTYTI
jgi:hypothetical protein